MSIKIQSNIAVEISSFCNPENLLVTPVVAGMTIGYKPQTTYNKIYTNCFPLPLVTVRRRKMVRVSDLLAYVADLEPIPVPTPPKKRGRPSNASKAAMTATHTQRRDGAHDCVRRFTAGALAAYCP